jgi:ABC-type transporter Mla subunit MlaD
LSAVTVTLTAICSGGNHLTFTATGDATDTLIANLSDLSDPLTDQEKDAFVKVIAKLAKLGRTLNQAKTLLQAGVTVTV